MKRGKPQKPLYLWQKKKKKECFVASDEIPLTLLLSIMRKGNEGSRGRKILRAQREYSIYARKSAERIDLKITPKRPLAIGLRGPLDAWRSRFARGEGKRGKGGGFPWNNGRIYTPKEGGRARGAKRCARPKPRKFDFNCWLVGLVLGSFSFALRIRKVN